MMPDGRGDVYCCWPIEEGAIRTGGLCAFSGLDVEEHL